VDERWQLRLELRLSTSVRRGQPDKSGLSALSPSSSGFRWKMILNCHTAATSFGVRRKPDASQPTSAIGVRTVAAQDRCWGQVGVRPQTRSLGTCERHTKMTSDELRHLQRGRATDPIHSQCRRQR
jgi:hypothetical protein